MFNCIRAGMLAALVGLLVACGGGGGNSAPGVEPGPAPPNQPVPPVPIPPTPSPNPYAQAQALNAFITAATLNESNQPVIDFQLSDGDNVAITDLAEADVRFVISKLETSPLGSSTGTWQSYINVIAQPAVGIGTVPRLQGAFESVSSRNFGEFTNLGEGKYRYRYLTSLTNLPADVLAQAAAEGLDLGYDPGLTHRVAIQFDGAPSTANPIRDWIPATGATDGVFAMDIAATANCNRCHDPLAVHGGNRQEVKYCVTCHNAGSVDPDSTNTVDFKVMIHKIHRGVNLPSVIGGEPYVIYGFRNTPHDYSHIHFPQDIRNCVNCHVGSATGGLNDELTETSQGDNWSIYATQAACGSCHDDVDFSSHAGGQPDDSNCDSCHSLGGAAGSIQASHEILAVTASQQFMAEILSIDSSMQGEQPVVSFRISNPDTGDDYDILTDPVFTGASVSVRTAWNTVDYTNTGNGQDNASSVAVNALSQAVANGDGSFRVTMPLAIPNGTEPPFIPATGSGAAVIEGRLSLELESGAPRSQVPLTNVHAFFSIDEASGMPVPRRTSVELENCLSCHQVLSLHGSNRTDDIDSCVTCHNPRNTDRSVRAVAVTPPTDGKEEESLDFKTMIHGIHAASMRENPLQIVGFRGFTTYIYDEEAVQYPGNLGNCEGCHTATGYTLPLADGVLATTVDTGSDGQSPVDDTVVTPVTSVCSSCHDGTESAAHMMLQGGNFNTTQAAIDDGTVVETCNVCHAAGRTSDVSVVHDIP